MDRITLKWKKVSIVIIMYHCILILFQPVIENPGLYNLVNDGKALSNKQILMVDEHPYNKDIVDAVKKETVTYFDYQVWQTDHGFTNKRVSLMNTVLKFLEK